MSLLELDEAGRTGYFEDPQKSTVLGEQLWGFWHSGTWERDQLLSRSKSGAAEAYYIISYVEKCVELLATGITSLPYVVKRYSRLQGETGSEWEGQIVARDSDVVPQHPYFKLFHDYLKRHHVSLLFRIAISLTLYDECYLELVRRYDQYPAGPHNPLLALDWLNPLGVTFTAQNGRVQRYYYSPFDNSSRSAVYRPFEIVYKHGFNPRDDLRGYPDILAAMESMDIDRNIQRAVVSHFRNGIQAQAIVSPKEGFSNYQAARDRMSEITKTSRGPENVGGMVWWPKNVEVTKMDYPRYDQLTSYSKDNVERILDQFGVPRAMVGNSDIAGYKQGDEVTYRFYVGNIIPRALDVVDFMNWQIVPVLPREYAYDRVEVDTSEFSRVSENDLKEADLADKNLRGSIITINEARKRQGMDEWPKEQGDLLLIPPGTIFISPTDLKSGFVAGMPPEEAATAALSMGREGPLTPAIGELTAMAEESETPPTPAAEEVKTEEPERRRPVGMKQPEWDWTVEKAQRELDNWYRFITRKGKQGLKHLTEFVSYYTRGTVSDWLVGILKTYDQSTHKRTVKSYFEEAKQQVAIKAIQATRIDFEDQFEDLLTEFIKGNLSRRQWSGYVRQLLRKTIHKAFLDGMEDGGVEGEQPDDEEKVIINEFIQNQAAYVTGLGDAVKAKQVTTAVGRGVMWYNKSVAPMYQAGLASAAGNVMVEWVLGPTKEHCRSCAAYNGQRHRYKSWLRVGAIPQSDTLECGGFNCLCHLVPVRARARGRLKLVT